MQQFCFAWSDVQGFVYILAALFGFWASIVWYQSAKDPTIITEAELNKRKSPEDSGKRVAGDPNEDRISHRPGKLGEIHLSRGDGTYLVVHDTFNKQSRLNSKAAQLTALSVLFTAVGTVIGLLI